MNGQQFSSSGVEYTYVSSASVSSVWPLTAVSEVSTPVTVSGSGFMPVSESLGYLLCRFNTTSVRAEYVSSTSVVCNSSESSVPGYVSVEVTTNGVDFTSDGVHLLVSDVLVSEVSPWTGPELGGTVVTVLGSGLDASDSLRCRFNEAESVVASVHSSSEVRCVSPLSSTGWSVVDLLSHDESLRSGGSFFVHSVVWVSAVHPLLGPVSGGTRLGLVGSHFRESSSLVCRFEESSKTVVGRYIGVRLVECVAPAMAGITARRVEVSINGQQFSSICYA